MTYVRNPLPLQLDKTTLGQRYNQALAANQHRPLADESLRALALDLVTEAAANELRAIQSAQFAGPSDAQQESNRKAFYSFYAPRGKTIEKKQADGVTMKQRPPLVEYKVRLVDLPAFCKQMGLNAAKLAAVGEGVEKEHKDWRQGSFSGNPVDRQFQRGTPYKTPIDYSLYMDDALTPGEVRSQLPIVREVPTWGVQPIEFDPNHPDAPSPLAWEFGQVMVGVDQPKTANTPFGADGDVMASKSE